MSYVSKFVILNSMLYKIYINLWEKQKDKFLAITVKNDFVMNIQFKIEI